MTQHQNRYAFTRDAAKIRMERMLALLEVPMTRGELAQRLSCTVRTAQVYLAMLHEARRIHVHGWRPNHPGSPSALYLVGDKPDKRKPKPLNNHHKAKLYRERNPEKCLQATLKKRADRAKPKRDPLVAAFFGAPTY